MRALVRLFLIRFIALYGVEGSAKSMESFHAELHMPLKAIRGAIEYLDAKGFLKIEAMETKKKGRKISRYTCQPVLRQLLKKPGSVAQEKVIREIIGDASTHAVLNRFLRVLLATLLKHADETGVVSGLGTSDFMSLTGMKRDRVKDQIQKLKELGYISASVTGLTNPLIFNAAATVYFLDLRKIARLDCDRFGGRITAYPEVFNHSLNFSEASTIFSFFSKKQFFTDLERIREVKYGFAYDLELEDLAMFFAVKKGRFQNQEYFQAKINRYACILLNEGWDVSCLRPEGKSKSLKDKIVQDINPHHRHFPNIKSDDEFSESVVKLREFIYAVSYSTARAIAKILKDAEIPLSEAVSIVLLPFPLHRHPYAALQLVIDYFHKNVSGGFGCKVIRYAHDGKAFVCSCEEDERIQKDRLRKVEEARIEVEQNRAELRQAFSKLKRPIS